MVWLAWLSHSQEEKKNKKPIQAKRRRLLICSGREKLNFWNQKKGVSSAVVCHCL
uniref:Uncharacterized protein n=1 Tax=Anguilla anguilla TaxID=7936 RepID=A0A0E9WQD7_ANGAN